MPSVANFPRTLQTGALERKPSTHACVVAFRVATARDVTYRQVMPGALAAAIVWQQTVDIPVPAAAISLAARAIGATGGRALLLLAGPWLRSCRRSRLSRSDSFRASARLRRCAPRLLCCERICERNAAQLPRWRETRRDGWDGRLIVTCAFETECAGGDGDRLAHDLEVITCPATPGCTSGARCCWSLFMCLASIALGPLAVVRVCFHQIWPWWWRKIVVVADDLGHDIEVMTDDHRRVRVREQH
jgi:hypothetical protein